MIANYILYLFVTLHQENKYKHIMKLNNLIVFSNSLLNSCEYSNQLIYLKVGTNGVYTSK